MPNIFETEIKISPSDIYFNGHVSNDIFVRWMYETALEHSIARNLDLDAYTRLNIMIVVKRNEVDYHTPAHLEDTSVIVKTWVGSLRKTSAVRYFEVYRKHDHTLLAKAQSVYVCVNLTTRRPTRLPEEVITAFS